MPVKTILLHLTDDERHGAALAVAADLSRRFAAFVEVLYVAAPIDLPASEESGGASYADLTQAAVATQHEAVQVERDAARALKDCPHSWTAVDGDHVAHLATRAVTADLAIVTQPPSTVIASRALLHLPDRLPLAAPCPTLILPPEHAAGTPVGRNVVIAWKAVREASVAVRNALPFLRAAEAVTILTVEAPRQPADGSVAALTAFLDRHGVKARRQTRLSESGEVGEAILDGVRDLGGDLLVMGAYGHSRLREMVLGGETRTVLRRLDVPALMSH